MTEDQALPEVEFRIRTLDGTIKSATIATAPGHYQGEKVAQAMVYK